MSATTARMSLHEIVAAVNLARYCGDGPLAEPWCAGRYVYAASRALMIRVPWSLAPEIGARTGVPAKEAALCFSNHLYDGNVWESLPTLPALDEVAPVTHEQMPSVWPVRLGVRVVNLVLLAKVAALPQVEIAPHYGDEAKPLSLRFAGGGRGLLSTLDMNVGELRGRSVPDLLEGRL